MDIIYNKIFSVISGNKAIKNEKKQFMNLSDTPANINQLIISDSELYSEQMPSSISSANSTDSIESTDSINSINSINSIESSNSNISDKLSNNFNKTFEKVKTNEEIKTSKRIKVIDKTHTSDTSDTSDTTDNKYNKYNQVSVSVDSEKSDDGNEIGEVYKFQKDVSENANNSDSFNNSDSSDDLSNKASDKKLTIESAVEKKYMESVLLNKKKYYEEIKELNTINLRAIEISIIKNSYSNVFNLLMDGEVLYKKDVNDNIIKICSNKNCNNKCEKSICNKNGLYYSLWNDVRGVKTIYNLLIKLIILYPQFRNKCKCCEDDETKNYLAKLEQDYNQNAFRHEENNNKKMELKINYLVNKFLSVIGIMTCQCKFVNKYYEFYQENYLNFRKMYKIYKRTVPYVIPMLKVYFNIKENHEDLTLIKDSRCIHEDIRYNNFTHCLKKLLNNVDKKKIMENICNLELVNIWTMESFEISLLLFNEQSLETFRHVLFKYKKEIDIIDLFKRIYNKKNNIINLNYVSNKKNLLNSLLYAMKNKKHFESENGKRLINIIISQLYYRHKKYKELQNKINEMMLQYLIECINYGQMRVGLEFLKNIKNLHLSTFITRTDKSVDFNKYSIINVFPNGLNKNSNYFDLIKYIFETILESDVNYQIKISYLKIINKNKINVIQYDFINKLIDISGGEKIILELMKYTKSDNSTLEHNDYFLNLNNYENVNYINSIITKCVIKQRVNILDYLLYGLNSKIKEKYINLVNPYLIYFFNVNDYKKERDYIEILKIITKYKYNINATTNIDIREVKEHSKNNYNLLYCCIKNKLNESAKILINNQINTLIICENKNLLYHCIDYKNHIIFGVILSKDNKLINDFYGNIKLYTYLFTKKELEENTLMRFLIKLIKIKGFDTNYNDKENLHIGFQILGSNISKRNKILLFKLLIDEIDSMIIKDNIPLILYSVILDEYEITYMLLNKLIANKNIKINSSGLNPLLNYEYVSEKTEINFIPVIFKYIKENTVKNQIQIDKLYLEVDIYVENILVMIVEIVVFILMYNFDLGVGFLDSKNKKETTKIKNKSYNKEELNGYLAIDHNISNEVTSENGYMEISAETDSIIKPNKNIWKGVKDTNIKNVNKNSRFDSNIKFKFKSESSDNNNSDTKHNVTDSEITSDIESEFSEIEESEICFDNLI